MGEWHHRTFFGNSPNPGPFSIRHFDALGHAERRLVSIIVAHLATESWTKGGVGTLRWVWNDGAAYRGKGAGSSIAL